MQDLTKWCTCFASIDIANKLQNNGTRVIHQNCQEAECNSCADDSKMPAVSSLVKRSTARAGGCCCFISSKERDKREEIGEELDGGNKIVRSSKPRDQKWARVLYSSAAVIIDGSRQSQYGSSLSIREFDTRKKFRNKKHQ